MKILKSLIYWFLGLLFLAVAATVALPALNYPLPYQIYSIDSGSMNPTLPVGSLILIQKQPEYAKDDIITFRAEANPKTVITHRVVSREKDDDISKHFYQTKGDANEDPDPEPVDASRVIGKVIFHAPIIGHLPTFAKTQTGFVILIIIPATLIVYSELVTIKTEIVRLFTRKKSSDQPKNES